MLYRCAHFAIYDGHGGRLAAEYAQKHLHKSVLSAGLPSELVCLSMHLVDCSNLSFHLKKLDFLFNFGGFLFGALMMFLSWKLQLDVKTAKKAILNGIFPPDFSGSSPFCTVIQDDDSCFFFV